VPAAPPLPQAERHFGKGHATLFLQSALVTLLISVLSFALASPLGTLKEEPRWPDVPNETRCSRTDGSGFWVKYSDTSFVTSTRVEAGAGRPARG
jgi:hypothetical protein